MTGAGGFLGRHVVAEALRRGHSVRAIIRPASREPAEWLSGVEVFRADLRGSADLVAAFEDVDVLIHLAAAVGGGDDLQFASTVVGTERLLAAMSRSNTRRMVLASSFSVYDWNRIRGTVTEESPLAGDLYARDGYAVAKVWQERVTRTAAQQHGWQLTVVRPGWIWGSGNSYLSGIGQSAGPFLLLFGALRELALTHVQNCADCFVTCADDARSDNETFNVVDDHRISNWRYAGTYLRNTGSRQWRIPLPYWFCLLVVRLAHLVSRLIFRGKGKLPGILIPCRFQARFNPVRARATKLRRVLDWRPPLSFDEAVAITYPDRQTSVEATTPLVAAAGREH